MPRLFVALGDTHVARRVGAKVPFVLGVVYWKELFWCHGTVLHLTVRVLKLENKASVLKK